MRRSFIALAAVIALGFSSPIEAQQDSTEVIVINRTDLEVIITPEGPVRRFRGDSLQFTAVAVDTVSGDTLDVEFSWSSTNSNVLTIEPTTGMAHFLNRGNAAVVVEVVRLVSLLFMTQEDTGIWREVYSPQREATYAANGVTPDELVMEVGTSRPICVFAEDSLGRIELAVPLDDMGVSETGTKPDGTVVPGTDILTVTYDPMQTDCPSWSEAQAAMPVPAQLMYQATRVG